MNLVKNNKKKIIIVGVMLLVLTLVITGTYALWTYFKEGPNQVLVSGEIFMKYNGTRNINITNVMPSDTYNKSDYFEFDIVGKNTSSKDVVYEIVLDRGEEPDKETERTERLDDKYLKFRLVEVKGDQEEELIQEGSYDNITNKKIWVDNVKAGTKEEIKYTYRLYAWISDEAKIGNTEGAIPMETWNKTFASVKVTVNGDFEAKDLTEDYMIINAVNESGEPYDLKHPIESNEDIKVTLASKREVTNFVVTKSEESPISTMKLEEPTKYPAIYKEEKRQWEAEVTIDETGIYKFYAEYSESEQSKEYSFTVLFNPDRYIKVEKPTEALCKTGLVYNGESQDLVENPNQDGYTFIEYQQTDAGTHQVKAHLNEKHRWIDNSLEDATIDCSIDKATPVLSLSSENGEVLEGKEIVITASVEPKIEGTYEAVSNQDTIARAQVEENRITITGVSYGEAIITVNFKPTDNQNYNEPVSKTYSVNGYKIATEAVCSNPTYNGVLQPLASGGIGMELQNNSMKDANTYQVIEKLNEGYRWEDNTTNDRTLSCKIEPKPVTDVTVNLGSTDFIYDGHEKQPTVTSVLDGSIPLTLTTDYKVSYNNNTNAGTNTAKVIITGQGNYTGTKEIPFTIKQVETILNYNPPILNINTGSSGIVTINANTTGTWDISSNSMANATVTYSPEISASKVVTVQGVSGGSTTLSITFTPTDITNYTTKIETYNVTITDKKAVEQLKNDIESHKTSTCNPTIEESGTIYLSGTNDCINFNYVWYSGKLWRITAINSDNTMKMITQDTITTIHWGTSSNFYRYSWIRQWLNEDFLDTLENSENIIFQDSTWNPAKQGGSSTDKSLVGTLSESEYTKAYQNASTSTNYLNLGRRWWLITPYESSYVRMVTYEGDISYVLPLSYSEGVRPSIILKPNILISGGEGTKENPYRINGDKETAKLNDKLNSRVSGEYVNFDGKKYRIVGIENEITKLTSVDYLRDDSGAVIEKNFGSDSSWVTSVASNKDNYWGYYLNNTWYNSINPIYKNMLVEGTYYLGKVGEDTAFGGYSSAKSDPWQGKVGLPRIGEMFSAQFGERDSTSRDIWLITPYYGKVWIANGTSYASLEAPSSKAYAVRPSINLNSNVIVISGEGTEQSPYELSCDTCTATSSPSTQEDPTIFDDNVVNNTKNIATTGTCNNLVYNGETQTLVSGGSNVSYENNNQVDAGTYQVTAKANTGYTFSDGTKTKILTCDISKKIVPVNFNTNILKYNGTYQSPIATATGVKGEAIELETTKEKELGEFTTIATMKNVNPNYSLSNTVLDYKITNTNESNKITNITKLKINYYLKNKDIDSYSLVKSTEQNAKEGEIVTGELINFTNYKTPKEISIKIIKGVNVIEYYYEREN